MQDEKVTTPPNYSPVVTQVAGALQAAQRATFWGERLAQQSSELVELLKQELEHQMNNSPPQPSDEKISSKT